MKIVPAIFGSSLLFFFALSAHAEEPASTRSPAESFLDRTVVLDDIVGGVFIIGTPTSSVLSVAWLSFGTGSMKSFGSDSTSTTYGVAPSADFFVGPRGLSVGGRIAIAHADQRQSTDAAPGSSFSSSSTTREFAPRVGWAFPVTDSLVLWPRVELGIGSGDSKSSGSSMPDQSGHSTRFSATGELGLLFPIQRHLSFTFGPRITYSTATSDDSTSSSNAESKQFYVSVRGAMRIAF